MYHACIRTHRFCAECGTPEFILAQPLSACGRCYISWYCSRECQLAAWEQHKCFCSPANNASSDSESDADLPVVDSDAIAPPAVNLHDDDILAFAKQVKQKGGRYFIRCVEDDVSDNYCALTPTMSDSSASSDETPTQSRPVSGAATPVAVTPTCVMNKGILTPPASPPTLSPGGLSVSPPALSTPLTPVNSTETDCVLYPTFDGRAFTTSHLLGSSSAGRAADRLGPFPPTADLPFEQALDEALMVLRIRDNP